MKKLKVYVGAVLIVGSFVLSGCGINDNPDGTKLEPIKIPIDSSCVFDYPPGADRTDSPSGANRTDSDTSVLLRIKTGN